MMEMRLQYEKGEFPSSCSGCGRDYGSEEITYMIGGGLGEDCDELYFELFLCNRCLGLYKSNPYKFLLEMDKRLNR